MYGLEAGQECGAPGGEAAGLGIVSLGAEEVG